MPNFEDNTFKEGLYGFYRGIVVQNDDPEKRGRVKIAIPQFFVHYLREANLPQDTYLARFVGGENIVTVLDATALEKFSKVLKWAEQASPLIGAGTAGVFDAKNKIATVGEGYNGSGSFEDLKENSITRSGEPVSPKATRSINGTPGGFDIGYKTGIHDLYNQLYAPTQINNATKGIFSVPRVGAHVWLFFDQGSAEHPVYMAYVFDGSDWRSVVNPQKSNPSPHYPAGAENKQDKEPFFLTGQTVLNTKAGSLEFIDTDDFEKIKMSHYSGSFYEMNNHFTCEVSVENKSSIVYQNETETVFGDHAKIVQGDAHLIYRGHTHITYGDPDNKTLYDQWVETAKPAFLHAALFSQPVTIVKDPTTNGAAKKNQNSKYRYPNNQLSSKPKKTWSLTLANMNPTKHMKLVQHKELGVVQV
jgi:hypothetical protein